MEKLVLVSSNTEHEDAPLLVILAQQIVAFDRQQLLRVRRRHLPVKMGQVLQLLERSPSLRWRLLVGSAIDRIVQT